MAKEVKSMLVNDRIMTESGSSELFESGRYGILKANGRIQLSFLEALYLIEKERLKVFNQRRQEIDFESLFRKAKKQEQNLNVRYSVFRDFRDRGYIIKTALKFGADFRVYDRGIKPGEDHAKWIVFAVHEGQTMTWRDFAAKNRVAHSTKKKLLIAVVDDEGDVSYWESRWLKP